MPVRASVYFSIPPATESGEWTTEYRGSLMTTKKDGFAGPRYVLALSKKTGEENGRPIYSKAAKITWSNGEEEVIADRTLMVKMREYEDKPKDTRPQDFKDDSDLPF